MKECVLAVIVGLEVGFLFKWLKLPVPAPNVLPGVLGIVGIYVGAKIAEVIFK